MPYINTCCTYIFILWTCLIPEATSCEEEFRHLEFRGTQAVRGQRLINHVIRSANVTNKEFCGALCFMEPKCVSYNLMTKNVIGKHKCELNKATYEDNIRDMEQNPDYVYRGAKNACGNDPCKNEATCQIGFTHKGYRCLCTAGFTGQHCEFDIDECAAETLSCDVNAECLNLKGSYNCSCKAGYKGDGETCEDVDECTTGSHNCISDDLCENTIGSFECITWSCEELYNRNVKPSIMIPIFGAFNTPAGETGFDTQETKLPTYWNTSFTKICLGMKIPGEETANFITLNQSANSLYSLIADGQFHPTSVGREMWKSLLGSQGSLQLHCNIEGFNVVSGRPNYPKARIGIIANNEDFECDSCDSRIGFGSGGHPDDSNTCGINAQTFVDNGPRHIKVMGYTLIQ